MFGLTCVREVFDAPVPSRLPGAPGALEGVFALRGIVLPLWRTDHLLGVAGDAAPGVCLRIMVDDVHAGLLVDNVHGLATLGSDRGPSDAWWTDSSGHVDIAGRNETVTVVDIAAMAARMGAR